MQLKTWLVAAGFLLSVTPLGAEHWPRFRGASGQGVSADRLPVTWSPGSNVRWRAELPGEGWSSPIVWADAVFLTVASEAGVSCRVVAFDRDTGRRRWEREIARQALRQKEKKNSYATPTPATDGRRVYASCGDGTLAGLRLDGTVAWTNTELPFYGQHGLGSSLLVHRDLVIMARDGSSDGPDRRLGWQTPWDQAFLVALDATSGRVRWKASRGLSRIAHATPIVVGLGGRDVLVSAAGDVIQAFDPATGDRLWSVPSPGEGVVPSPVMAGGVIVSTSGFGQPMIRAVRPVPSPVVAWEQSKGVPMQSSPIYVAPRLYTVTDAGILTALDARTGEIEWQERLEGTFSASPVAGDGRIYFLNEDCDTLVIAAGARFEVLARNSLEGRCQASMAAAPGLLFIRSDRYLYALER